MLSVIRRAGPLYRVAQIAEEPKVCPHLETPRLSLAK